MKKITAHILIPVVTTLMITIVIILSLCNYEYVQRQRLMTLDNHYQAQLCAQQLQLGHYERYSNSWGEAQHMSQHIKVWLKNGYYEDFLIDDNDL